MEQKFVRLKPMGDADIVSYGDLVAGERLRPDEARELAAKLLRLADELEPLAPADSEIEEIRKLIQERDEAVERYRTAEVGSLESRKADDQRMGAIQHLGESDLKTLLTRLETLEEENQRLLEQLQQVADIAVLALHDVFANSGRDGYNAWYFLSTMKAHEEIARVLGKEKWELWFDAADRDSTTTQDQ